MRKKGFLTVCAVALMLFSAAAHGSLILSDSASVPLTQTRWTNSVSLKKFDPSQGTLQRIEITLTGHVDGSAMFESRNSSPATVTMIVTAQVALQRPDATALVTALPTTNVTETVGPFDLNIDFAGVSGRTYSQLTNTDFHTYTIFPSDLDSALFVGTGDIVLPILATASSHADGPGNLTTGFNTQASADVTITYTYDAIPEPSAICLAAAALTICAARRPRRS